MARVSLALLAIAACLLLIRAAARIGFSRLLTRYAVALNSLTAADQAIQLTPADPEAHRARATVLSRQRRLAEAETSLEVATTLRSRDDLLWLELGSMREELGDNDGAIAAFNEAVRWAPYYAHPRWQRGNLFLRMGRYDDALADLRYAAKRNRKFFPNLIDLSWNLTGHIPSTTRSLLEISDDQERLVFARFLAEKGKGADVAEQIRLLRAPLSDENKEELVRLLVAARSYREAFEIGKGTDTHGAIVNGGFEEPLVNKTYFRWIFYEGHAKPKFAIDVSEKFGGAKSLQISLDGELDPKTSLLSQMIAVQSGQRYRLNFAVKTNDLVTGGPPRIVVTDAANDQILGRSETFPRTTNAWQQMSVEFTVPQNTAAAVIRLVRENCASAPCPMFGVMWLDEFSLEKL